MKIANFYKKIIEKLESLEKKKAIKVEFLDQSFKYKNFELWWTSLRLLLLQFWWGMFRGLNQRVLRDGLGENDGLSTLT